MSLIHCLQGQLKVICNFTTEVNLKHSEIQESQETQTSIPLTLVLTKTHTRRASGHLAPNVGSGLAQQKEADYSLSLSFTFHLFIFARVHSTRAVTHFTSVFKLKLRFEGAAGFSEPQGSICSRPAVLRMSAGVWWIPFIPAGTKTYAKFTPLPLNISVKCQLLCLCMDDSFTCYYIWLIWRF